MACPICPSCEGGWPKHRPPSVGLEVHPMYTADKRLYLTADRARVVEEGDPEAAFLLVAEGGSLQDDEAERLGLTGKRRAAPEPVVVHSIAADPEPEPEPEAKAVASAPANKARAKAEDK